MAGKRAPAVVEEERPDETPALTATPEPEHTEPHEEPREPELRVVEDARGLIAQRAIVAHTPLCARAGAAMAV